MKITGRIIMSLLGETKLIRFVQNFFEPFSIGNHDAIGSWRLLDKERSQLMDGKKTNSHSTFMAWAERLKQEGVYNKLVKKIEMYQSQNA